MSVEPGLGSFYPFLFLGDRICHRTSEGRSAIAREPEKKGHQTHPSWSSFGPLVEGQQVAWVQPAASPLGFITWLKIEPAPVLLRAQSRPWTPHPPEP